MQSKLYLKHDLPDSAEALYLPNKFFYSQRQKEENLKDVHGKSVSKIKGKLVSHLNLNLVVLHDWSLSLSAFSIVCSTRKRKLLFQIIGIGQLTVQFTQKNCKNIFNNIFHAHVFTFLLMFLQFQHEWQNLSFDVRHLTSGTIDVPLGLEITPSCRLWLKNFSCLSYL